MVGDVELLENVLPPRRSSLRGAVLRAKQALKRGRPEWATAPPPGEPIRGTAAEMRARRGHSVPPPPRTWAGLEGHRDDDLELQDDAVVTVGVPREEDLFEWAADRLDTLDATVIGRTSICSLTYATA